MSMQDETLLSQIHEFFDTSQWDEACTYLQEQLALDTSNETLHFYLGYVYAQLEQYDRAIEAYQKALAVSPTAQTFLYLGEAYCEIERFHEAEQAYREAIALDTEWHAPRSRLATFLYDRDREEEALPIYQHLLATGAEFSAQEWYEYGYCLRTLNQYQKAKEAFQKALELEPNDADTLFSLGDVSKENLSEAMEYYQRALNIEPDHKYALRGMATTYISLGISERQPTCFHKAEHILRELVARNLQPEWNWCYLGQALYWQNRYEEAEAAYFTALSVSRSTYTLMQLGDLYEEIERFQEAERAYREAIALDTEWHAPHFRLATFLYDRGRHEEALPTYQHLLSTDAEFSAQKWREYGYCLSANNQSLEAIDALQRSLELEPNNADTLFYLGNAYMDSEQFHEALSIYEPSLLLTPDAMDLRFNIGIALHKLKRDTDAQPYFEAVLASPNADEDMKQIARNKLQNT